MKKKSLAALLSGLLKVSLTGVGFASWIIVSDATKELANVGSVTVEAVEDRRLSVDATITDGNVNFGPQEAKSKGWLITTSTLTAQEDLTFTFSVTVSNSNYLDSLSVAITNTAYTQKADVWTGESLTTEGYVTALPTIANVNNSTTNSVAATPTTKSTYGVTVTKSGEGKDATTTFAFTVKLNWGGKFDNKNPYDYYNDGVKTAEDYAGEAATALTAVYGLNSAKFTITLNAVASRD